MRIWTGMGRAVAAAALAAAAAACGGIVGGNEGNAGGNGGPVTDDAVGKVLPPDSVVRILEIDRSQLQTAGKVRYRVENVSGSEQPDLMWSVTFVFPPEESGELLLPDVKESTAEMPLRLVADGRSEFLEAVCPNWTKYSTAGTQVEATRLNMQVEEPVPARARSGSEPGTYFVAGKLECVGMSDDLYGESTLWLEFENVTATRLPPFEVQAVFGERRVRTPKKGGPGLDPGQRARVELDIAGLDLGDRSFAVKVNFRGL